MLQNFLDLNQDKIEALIVDSMLTHYGSKPPKEAGSLVQILIVNQ